MNQGPSVTNRVQLLVVSDVYETGVNDDNLLGVEFQEEDLISQEVLIKHTVVISLEDEFREGYDIQTNCLKPEWTVIDRWGEGTHFLTVAHSYTEIKAMYRRLEEETNTFFHRYTKVENE